MTDQIDSTIRGKRAIGVHVRGTDFKRNYKGHPVKIGTEEYLEAAKKMFAAGKYDMVFLATDDSEAIVLGRPLEKSLYIIVMSFEAVEMKR